LTNSGHSKEYDDRSFWEKLRRFALRAGRAVVEKAVTLYYCLRDPETPAWAKSVIVGALGYFIFPMDAIPDFIPGVGYSDDLGVLIVALTAVLTHIKPEHREQARELIQWKWTRTTPKDGEHEEACGQGNNDHKNGHYKDLANSEQYCARVLGLEGNITSSAIRERYLALVKRYHPDRVQHLGVEFQKMAEQKLKDINEAYAYLAQRYSEGRGQGRRIL